MKKILSLIALALGSTSGLTAKNPQEIIPEIKGGRCVVLFQKPSCPYCVYLKPKFEELKKANTSKGITFVEKMVTPEAKSAFGFSTVPTVIYYKDGKEMRRHGSENKTITTAAMQKYVNELN